LLFEEFGSLRREICNRLGREKPRRWPTERQNHSRGNGSTLESRQEHESRPWGKTGSGKKALPRKLSS
jgi:hypothetical protein